MFLKHVGLKSMDMTKISDDILKSVMAKANKPSRGRKLCIECGNYVGVRTTECNCGHIFVKGESRQLTTKEEDIENGKATEEEKRYSLRIGSTGGSLIYVGAGSCPATLSSLDFQGVSQFCNDVVYAGLNEDKIYTPSAIMNWLQHKFEYNSAEYKIALDLVDEWYRNLIGD